MRRKNIYIAGPMRGIKDFNFPSFNEKAEYLRAHGWNVFNPAEKDVEKYGEDFNKCPTGDMEASLARGFSLREALAVDLSWIALHADAIYLLPGWENSKGAVAEHALAEALGLDIIYVVEGKKR